MAAPEGARSRRTIGPPSVGLPHRVRSGRRAIASAAAVIDGQVVFSDEVAWSPSTHRPIRSTTSTESTISLRASGRASAPAWTRSAASAGGRLCRERKWRVGLPLPRRPEGAVRYAHSPPLLRPAKRVGGGVPFDVVNDGEVTAPRRVDGVERCGRARRRHGQQPGCGAFRGTPAGATSLPGSTELAFRARGLSPGCARRPSGAAIPVWALSIFSQQAVGRLLRAPAGNLSFLRTCRCP